jgi:hypothetical protein
MATKRLTWKAVTMGTPNCKTLAVMVISAMPPGAVPSTKVAVGKSMAWAINQENSTDRPIMLKVLTPTEANQCGAVRKKRGVN